MIFASANQFVKHLLPRSLMKRALLILVLPMLITQGGAIYFFYNQHWANVQRHLAMSLAGDVAFLANAMQHGDERERREITEQARELLDIEMERRPFDAKAVFASATQDDLLTVFVRELKDIMDEPFSIQRSAQTGENRVVLLIKERNFILKMQFSLKRLANVTTEIFIWWVLGSAILLLLIATLFLRNQIRPIRKLALAAEEFGKGQDTLQFRPQGASEVRQAGRSFIAMRERLKRMLSARTEMLAAISHDLRTPLTRMRLALAMLPDQKYAKPLIADVLDMEKMIQEYLDFARGEAGEEARPVRLSTLLADVVGRYTQAGKDVRLRLMGDPEITLFYNPMRRCLYNVIDNALKYGKTCEISTQERPRRVDICVDDDGPGIPEDLRELAKQPFKRLDPSRNLDKGGAGLGLSIVQDIVLRHGGEMSLEDAPLGGLRVKIALPL